MNIENISKYIEFNYDKEDIYKVSLATGYPGIALLLNETYKYTNDFKYYEACNKYLSNTISLIQRNPMYSTSLFSGSMGILFALATCSNSGENYKNITTQLLNEYDSIFDVLYSDLKNQIYNMSVSKEKFDLINGASGTLLCLLHILDIYGSEIHLRLNFWITKLTQLLESLIINKINNNISGDFLSDLGMSHGISGSINIIAASYERGFTSSTLPKTLQQSKDFLINSIHFHQNSYIIPNVLDNNSLIHRDAWCYGTPGVSFVLYNIAHTLKDENTIDISKFLAKETLQRSKKQRKLISPTFCHGYSGLAIINKILKNQELENYFYQLIKNTKKNNYKFMFKDFEYYQGTYKYIDSVSLLEGSAGVLLTLLSQEKFNSLWYKLFCFS
ncbi:lanthionine synthetase C family protein [Staphylococcus xylosus]|uniref:lanthionine synthetase C family protein n=1 Tax=Staphylococcus xylosus TaxID=1288 RepID=UPI00159F048D|nr:lanthionine synthetase C family protein [Staphylococcus xylosus]